MEKAIGGLLNMLIVGVATLGFVQVATMAQRGANSKSTIRRWQW